MLLNVVITILLTALSLTGSDSLWLTLFTAGAILMAHLSLRMCYKIEQPVVDTFHAFFFLGLACIATPWLLLLIPFFLCYLGVVMRDLTWRSFWAGFMGVLLPYAAITGISIYLDNYVYFDSVCYAFTAKPMLLVIATSAYPFTYFLEYILSLSVWQIITWVTYTLIGIFGIRHFFKTRYRYKIRERLLTNIEVYDSIAIWLLLLIFPQHYSSLVGGLAVSLSRLLYKRSTTWKVS